MIFNIFKRNNNPEKAVAKDNTTRSEMKAGEGIYTGFDKQALNVINPEIEALKLEIKKQDSLVEDLRKAGGDWVKEDMNLFKLTDRLEKLEAEKKKISA